MKIRLLKPTGGGSAEWCPQATFLNARERRCTHARRLRGRYCIHGLARGAALLDRDRPVERLALLALLFLSTERASFVPRKLRENRAVMS